jgi:hypothetical protein
MGYAKIYAGICGFITEVESASADRRHVKLRIKSTCPDVRRLIARLTEPTWDAYVEIGPCAAPSGNLFDKPLMRICGRLPHVACPVPSGICKAIEIAARLAMPRDAHITVADEPPAPAGETSDAASPPRRTSAAETSPRAKPKKTRPHARQPRRKRTR